METAILAIDQGTTNSKAILVSEAGTILSRGSAPVGITHPQDGWVEQDGVRIWESQLEAIRACLAAGPEVRLLAVGISNQRESVLAWDRNTGDPLGPVISWQCRRTAEACARLSRAGHGPMVMERTGLPLDPMFPATKIAWLVENFGLDGGSAAVGTVDSWLIWNLTGGACHATDASNASRTQLLNISKVSWDPELCELFGVPEILLPDVRDSSGAFGVTNGVPGLPDGIPIASAIGDSHAALFGQGAHSPGDGKVTLGTGSSIMTTLPGFAMPPDGLTTTIAWARDGAAAFAAEANILVSASIFPWAAELLGLPDVDALVALAESVPSSAGVSLVPAHVGLGAPHWSTTARGVISGLTFQAGPAHVARAAAESMAFQVADVFDAMDAAPGSVFVDGGPTRSAFLMQMLADILDREIVVRNAPEASALGAGYLAGLSAGLWRDTSDIQSRLPEAAIVAPSEDRARYADARRGWKIAVSQALMPQIE